MNHSELIARLRGLTGTLKSGAWSTIAEAADALQALERVPMTYEQALAINPKGYTVNEIFAFRCGLRAAEAHHGITPPESI